MSSLVTANPYNTICDRVGIDVNGVNHSDTVSASKVDIAVQVASIYNNTIDKHIRGLVASVNCKTLELNDCDPKWVWRSSEKVTTIYRKTD
jgi:hypothetical protein